MRNLNSGPSYGRTPDPEPRHLSQAELAKKKRQAKPGVANGYVNETPISLLKLRNGQFEQTIVQQQIPLDAIAERFYDRTNWVSGKFQGRNTTQR